MLADFFRFSMASFRNRKLRSSLTVLGIIIGVATIVALISVGDGLEYAVTEQFKKIGTNRIYVFAGGFGDPSVRTGLTTDDVEAMESLSEFEYVTPYLNKNVLVTSGNEEYTRSVFGFPTDDAKQRFEDLDIKLSEGRMFVDGEKNGIVIGSKTAEDLFTKELHTGNQITLNGVRLKIVGIMAPIGSPDDDNAIYVPMDTFREIVNDKKSVTMIEGVLKDGVDAVATADKMKRSLKRSRGDDLFEITTPDQFLETFGVIFDVIRVVLGGIAGISLVVGAVGIMNSMYTSVLERTREIGVMKAIGARNGDILTLFLLEAALIAVIGGIMGALIGTGFALLVEVIAHQSGFTLIVIKVSPALIAASIGFAGVVGALSGALPAHAASMLKPVDAMRY